MSVKSVYNFVPAPKEDEVFKPDWAEQVSHDIPFSDGESGEIEFTITAESPIFIRNGHSEQDQKVFEKYKDGDLSKASQAEKEAYKRFISFSNYNGKYFIPATSLKGMIRNNLEILSFSRLNPVLVNNHRYGFRDLTRGADYMKLYKSNDVEAGWLSSDEDGNWSIEVCSGLALLHHSEIDKIFNLEKSKQFRNLFLEKNPIEKTAKYKYSLIPKDESLQHRFKTKNNKNNKTIAYADSDGNLGTVVFTGQSSKRQEKSKKRPVGKVHEFVFFDSSKPVIIEVTKRQKKDFLFLYGDGDKNNESPDWAYWKREQKEHKKKIPVFLTRRGVGLLHFGLAFMYKLPYKNSIHELEPIKSYSKDKIDLASVIFGQTSKDSTKGRVYFGNAFAKENKSIDSKNIKGILGGPKASFYPYYIDQTQMDDKYMDYNNSESQLRGFKKYPIHDRQPNFKSGYLSDYSEKQKQNENVFSHLKPLLPGVEFKGKIRFHNLRKVEIGALISALTNHDQENQYFNIGGAKPSGFGKIKLELTEASRKSYLKYLSDFELCMNSHLLPILKTKWIETDQVRELVALNTPNNTLSYEYPILDMDSRIDDFKTIKKNKNSLKSHSSFYDKFKISSKIDEDSSAYKEFLNKLEDQEELDLSEFERFQDLSRYLNEELNKLIRFSEINKQNITRQIKFIYNNHNASRRKLQKDYDWENNISNWIGQYEAKQLREELKKE